MLSDVQLSMISHLGNHMGNENSSSREGFS